MKIICDFSVFYLDETLPKGSIVVECGNALLKNGYKLKILNTINFKKSIRNMKQYLLAALFNAPTTMQLYYQNKVNHDLAARR